MEVEVSVWFFLLWTLLVLVNLALLGLMILSLYLTIRVRRILIVVEFLRYKPGSWWTWSDILQGTGLKRAILIDVLTSMIRIGYVDTKDDSEAIAAHEVTYKEAERLMAGWEAVGDDLEAMREWQAEFQKVRQELLEFTPTHLTLKQFRFIYQGPRRRRRKPKLREKWNWLWPESGAGVYQPA